MKLIGKGNTAKVYEGEDKRAYKLFFEGYPMEAVRKEYENAVIMQKSGIPVPKVFEMVHEDKQGHLTTMSPCLDKEADHTEAGYKSGRNGISYECLHGASMLDRIFDTANVEEMIRDFCNLHKQVLEKKSTELMSYKDFYKMLAGMGQDEKLMEYIDQLPDGDFILHGDYHPGNVWINDDGRLLVIDFMNVCRGPREVDIARTYFLITAEEKDEKQRHNEELNRLKQMFGKAYLQMMETSIEELDGYIKMISECRKCEYSGT